MSNHLIAINHDPEALARHTEWEVRDAVTPWPPLFSAELVVTMIYESPPCAPFARALDTKEKSDAS